MRGATTGVDALFVHRIEHGDEEQAAPGRLIALPDRGVTYVRDSAGPEGAPVLLLLHGWTATADLNWSFSFPTLSQEFRVVALDHRGHGKGIRSTDAFTLEDCADDAAALLRRLGVASAIVVGYSMGGPIAQLMWRRHPDVVAGLVLCATSARFCERPWEYALFSLARLAGTLSRLAPVHCAVGAVRVWRRRLSTPRPILDLAIEAGDGHDWSAVLEAAAALGRFDSRPWVGEIRVPTAVVHTTRDHVVSPPRQRHLANAIRGASIHEVDGDHDACISRPDIFVPALVDACAAVAARVRPAKSAWPVGAPPRAA